MRPRARAFVSLALSLAWSLWPLGATIATAQAAAGKGLLRAEFWADVEPVAGVGDEWPVSSETARARVLDEAAWVYGGIIWGFEFRYTPFDKTRAIPERFEIQPIESLGPDALSFAAGAKASTLDEFRYVIECRPRGDLVTLMESYAQDPWRGSQGIGKADMNLGLKGRRAAYEDGLRAAVRSYLQGLEPNKPRLARGRVVFDRPPTMAILGGFYTVQLRARVMVEEVVPYKIY